MAKKSLLSVAPKSEFTAPVPIPTPDRDPEIVDFTFKYRDRAAMDAWVKELEAKAGSASEPIDADVDMVMGCVTGWDFEDEFKAESVRALLVQNPGAAMTVYQTYVSLSRAGKRKN